MPAPGEFVPLPRGYGWKIRRRTIAGVVLQILGAAVIAGMALLVVMWQREPDFHGWVDPLWRLNIAAGWVPAVVMIGAAINTLRVSGAIHGDALRRPDVLRLTANFRVWWIVSLAAAVLLVLAQLAGCFVVSGQAGGGLSASDFIQFFVPVLTLSLGSVLYLNVRYMLLKWPDDLMRTWRQGRLP